MNANYTPRRDPFNYDEENEMTGASLRKICDDGSCDKTNYDSLTPSEIDALQPLHVQVYELGVKKEAAEQKVQRLEHVIKTQEDYIDTLNKRIDELSEELYSKEFEPFFVRLFNWLF